MRCRCSYVSYVVWRCQSLSFFIKLYFIVCYILARRRLIGYFFCFAHFIFHCTFGQCVYFVFILVVVGSKKKLIITNFNSRSHCSYVCLCTCSALIDNRRHTRIHTGKNQNIIGMKTRLHIALHILYLFTTFFFLSSNSIPLIRLGKSVVAASNDEWYCTSCSYKMGRKKIERTNIEKFTEQSMQFQFVFRTLPRFMCSKYVLMCDCAYRKNTTSIEKKNHNGN